MNIDKLKEWPTLLRIDFWTQIKEGDTLLIQPKNENNIKFETFIVAEMIEIKGDIEVILDVVNNKYFSFSMYQEGKSWVNNVFIFNEVTDTRQSPSRDEWEYTEDPENDKTLWIYHEGKIKKGWFESETWNTTLKAMYIGDSDCNIKIQNVVCWCEIAIPKLPKDSK